MIYNCGLSRAGPAGFNSGTAYTYMCSTVTETEKPSPSAKPRKEIVGENDLFGHFLRLPSEHS